MVDMARVRVVWQNWPGAPGLSTFYLHNPPVQADIDAIRTFFNALPSLLPTGLTITVPNSGDVINDVDGTITGTWAVGTPPVVVTGTAVSNYAGNAGAVVHWLTDLVARNRRVRGRTFIVPLAAGAYDNTGSLATGTITTLTNAATALVASLGTNFRIWHRPKPPLGGGSGVVTGVRVPDLAVSMRSRRT